MKTLFIDVKLFVLLTIFSLFLFLFDNLNLLNFPKSILQIVLIPIQYGFYRTGQTFSKQVSFIFIARSAAQENQALRKQLGELFTENAELRKRISLNEALIDQSNSLSFKTYNLLPAKVVGLDRYLLIDQGFDSGVKIGQPVVYKNSFLGQVKDVSPKSATVMLSVDPDSKIAVFSQSIDGKARGILSGQYGSKLLMDKILHQEIVASDDLVYSEGTEGVLPKGLLMGKVGTVLERQNEVFKQAEVNPIFEVADLDLVFVIRNQ